MRDILLIALAALLGALAVCVPGFVAVRLMQRRSITANVAVLVVMVVLAVVAGILAVAEAMFISPHDLQVVLIVVPIAGALSLAVGLWTGRRMARAAVWAADARRRERELEAGRRQLIAWVSHDLRTPLAGMRAMAEALEDGVVDDPASVHEYHRRLRVEADRMTRLVDDLFELSRIHAGALNLTLDEVGLHDVVSDAIAAAAPIAANLGVRLSTPGDAAWPTVRASEKELSRVVANLVLNAIRYTPPDGTVTIDGGQDASGAWLTVSDTCGGIPETDLDQVFDVAFRGSRARTPDAFGNGGGLGLAIVRGLVEAHGGAVGVRNVSGGCRFEVRLPA
ncbi:sensor histidine kinase [Hamadaea tsunoensis]|uniref:sensor histidine kinase n=1 Tax=Hamadaea tsunoensis TaxID=53368 RepID=UPI0003FF8CFD|nr:HAMP domain-containing sensor histidine kinase [Hamadaea tsunoensis]